MLASEAEASAKQAAAALTVGANRAALTDDPMRHVLAAIANAVTVISRAGEPKIDERVIRSAVMSAVFRVSKDAISTMRWWVLAISILSIIVLCVGSVAMDRYLVRTPDPRWLSLAAMNDIGEAWRTCQPVAQPSGGDACQFILWTRLPVVRQR